MSGDQEHEHQSQETSEEPEETMKDLEVPEGDAEDVKGGIIINYKKDN